MNSFSLYWTDSLQGLIRFTTKIINLINPFILTLGIYKINGVYWTYRKRKGKKEIIPNISYKWKNNVMELWVFSAQLHSLHNILKLWPIHLPQNNARDTSFLYLIVLCKLWTTPNLKKSWLVFTYISLSRSCAQDRKTQAETRPISWKNNKNYPLKTQQLLLKKCFFNVNWFYLK